MRALVRYGAQFLLGLGLFVIFERAWFLSWEYYFRWLPRPLEAEEFNETSTLSLVALLFLSTQVMAFLGIWFVKSKSIKRNSH